MPAQSLAETFTYPLEALSPAEVYVALGTRPQGLTHAAARVRLQHYGRNTIRTVEATPRLRKLLAHFTHLMALLLWVGGLLGFLAQMPQLGVAIWLVILINGAFSVWQEYQAEQAMAALRRLLPTYARVVREGARSSVSSRRISSLATSCCWRKASISRRTAGWWTTPSGGLTSPPSPVKRIRSARPRRSSCVPG